MRYPLPKHRKQTIDQIMASVRLFLNISETIRGEQEEVVVGSQLIEEKLLLEKP